VCDVTIKILWIKSVWNENSLYFIPVKDLIYIYISKATAYDLYEQ